MHRRVLRARAGVEDRRARARSQLVRVRGYTNGRVQCAGQNSLGQLGRGARTPGKGLESPATVKEVEGATRIVAGAAHACAVAMDGLVLCWGQRGAPSGVAAPLGVPKSDQIGASQDELCVGGAGKVSCFGPSMTKTLTVVPGFADATQLSGGDGLMCALRKNGTVTCGDWWAAADGKVADRATEARGLAVGGASECVVGKDDVVTCNAGLPTKAVVEQL